MSTLKLQDIFFSYGKGALLQDFNLQVERGEIHCILGPSGCGKSTILHLIAGFLHPLYGTITLGEQLLERRIKGSRKEAFSLPTESRQVAMVFQKHCLFPHLDVEKNIQFGMKKKDPRQVEELLDLIGLPHKKKNYPHQLSGGGTTKGFSRPGTGLPPAHFTDG